MFFFFNDTATTEIYTLSLHDALPILRLDGLLHVAFLRSQHAHARLTSVDASAARCRPGVVAAYTAADLGDYWRPGPLLVPPPPRSEEHTSELQSQSNLVCRLLLEKKKPSPYTHPLANPNTGTFREPTSNVIRLHPSCTVDVASMIVTSVSCGRSQWLAVLMRRSP